MKKTLIAASIAALAAGSAQAVTLYESETGSFSTYGKVQLQLNNFDGENEIQNNGSRFGFSGETVLENGLTAFANAEFRFNAGYQHDAEMTVRNSFVGVRGDFGTVRAGNFDNLYYVGVSNVLDVTEQDGYRALTTDGGRINGDGADRGFSLAYETGDLGGFAFGLGVKHFNSAKSRNGAGYPSYSGDQNVGQQDGDQEWNVQAYAQFTMIDNLVLALAVDQNNEDAKGANTAKPTATDEDSDPIIGFSATYTLEALTASALVETAGDLTHFGLAANYNLGATNVYGLVSWLDNGDKDGVDFALGANYSLASNFMVYGEFAMGNDDVSDIQGRTNRSDANGDPIMEGVASITLGAAYTW